MPRKPEKPSRQNIEQFTEKHWGIEPKAWYVVDDPELGRLQLTEMGKLKELGVDPEAGKGEAGRYTLNFAGRCHLVWDAQCCGGRLYNVLTDRMAKLCRSQLWLGNNAPTYTLTEVAREAGGRQQGHYPNVRVKVVGKLLTVTYFTPKGGDPEERKGVLYEHEVAEETHIHPYLCVDSQGRLWWAGGDYYVHKDGIVN